MRILFIIAFSLIFITGSSQKKADIKLIDAELFGDTITVEYYIKNISSNSFSYYIPKLDDIKYYLLGISLSNKSQRKNYKYKVQYAGELDRLTVDKSKCTDILPGDSVYFKLSFGVDSFYLKGVSLKNKEVAISIFYQDNLIWCPDCKNKLLSEYLFAKKKLELK